MDISTVIMDAPASRGRRLDLRVLLAFTAIYVLWGATFLAIRIAVLEIPPFFSSGVRFLIAGALLYVFMRLRGQPSPSATEWRSIATIALCMFVATYGALFWVTVRALRYHCGNRATCPSAAR
jgi:drug/metabolite transporter (DMT)-like permease